MYEPESLPPEARGIPGEAVAAFERLLKTRGVRMHGYIMLSGGAVIAERYWPPYSRDTNHRMYSITKSFTSLAVGLLIGQGKLSLSDRVCDFFPDKLPPGGPHPWCARLTVEDLLTMRTCHGSTTYKRYDGDWVESFFHVPPDHIPGAVFAYDTSASHVLAALTERLSGMDMLDFLRQGALDELGFSRGAYILKDPAGVSQGGTGLMCTLRDVARVGYLCLHAGSFGGRQLIPERYMRRAVSNLVPTDLQEARDEQGGYGYSFWMPRVPGFVMYGMGGQLALCFPQADFCLATMADTTGSPEGLPLLYESFYETVWPHLERNMPAPPAAAPSPAPEPFCGRFEFRGGGTGWKWLELDPSGRTLRFETADGPGKLRYGDGTYVPNPAFPGTSCPCECMGEWKSGHLLLHCYVTGEEQGHTRMDLAMKDGELCMRLTATGEPFLRRFRGFASASYE